MQLLLSAPVLFVALHAHGGTSASLPSQQLRRNVQELPDLDIAAGSSTDNPLGQMIGVDAVDMAMGEECVMMCEVMKCHDHCSSKCGDEAKHIASKKKKYCEVYGPDPPPLAPELPGQLHLEHKHHAHHLHHHKKHFHACSSMHPCGECQGDCSDDTDCRGDLKCFQRGAENPTSGVPGCSGKGQPKIDYCYDSDRDPDAEGNGNDVCGAMIGVDVPKNCTEFSTCVYDYVLSSFIKDELPAEKIATQAKEDCKNDLLPVYNSTIPSESSGYADRTCDDILVEPIDNLKCDAFSACVLEWETNAKKIEAEMDCAALVDSNDISNPIFGKHVEGKCDDHLGGWKQTCDKYHECHLAPREMVCNYCSMPVTTGMYQCEPMKECSESCHDDCLFKVSCEDFCSMLASP